MRAGLPALIRTAPAGRPAGLSGILNLKLWTYDHDPYDICASISTASHAEQFFGEPFAGGPPAGDLYTYTCTGR